MSTSDLITVTAAAKHLPGRNGKRINRRTILRWIRKGCRGVRLDACKIGDVWYTTMDALDAFRRERTRRSLGEGVPVLPSPRRVDEQTARARRELERRGLYDTQRRQDERFEKAQAKMHRLPSGREGARVVSGVLPDGSPAD